MRHSTPGENETVGAKACKKANNVDEIRPSGFFDIQEPAVISRIFDSPLKAQYSPAQVASPGVSGI